METVLNEISTPTVSSQNPNEPQSSLMENISIKIDNLESLEDILSKKENTLNVMLKNSKSVSNQMTEEEEKEDMDNIEDDDQDDDQDDGNDEDEEDADDADDAENEGDEGEDKNPFIGDDTPTKDVDVMDEEDDDDEEGEEEDEEEDEDEDEDEEEDYSYFTNSLRRKYIESYHPENRNVNPEQLKALCTIVRDKHGHIIDDLHQTLPFMTKFEKTRIMGIRVNQLDNGADSLIDIPDTLIDSRIIAEMELNQKVLPYIISRPFPDGRQEFWNIQDLDLLDV